MTGIPRELIEAAATYHDMASGEEIDDLERAIERGEYDDVRDDAFLERWRQDAGYLDAAEQEMGGEWGEGEL